MDPTEQLLYAEENRKLLIDLKESIDTFKDVLTNKINIEVQQAEKISLDGPIKVNTEKSVEISNLQELSKAFDLLSTNITKAIEDNAPEVVKEVTIKNAKDIKTDSVTINNISDLAKYFTQLSSDIKKNRPIIEIEKQEVVFPTQANKPIAVRLSDGKSWINTLTSAISSAGGSDFRNSNGVGTQVQLTASGAVPVDIQDATVTINGDVTVSSEVEVKNDSGNPVPVSSTTLATSAKQDTIIGHVDGIEGLLTTIDADTGTIATEVAGLLTDTELRATPVPVSGTVTATPTGTQNVDVTANTIGLATGAKQDTGNTSLGSIDTKTPALGQALAAASTPVVLTAAQVSTLTPPAAITGFATETTLDAVKTAVQLIDNFISGSRGLVTEDNSAAIKTAVETIDNAIAGSEMQVDVVGALPAGTNAIGKLAANSGVDIGDVDVTSIAAGTNVIGGTYPTPSGVSAQALSNDTSTAYEASSVTKASAGTVYGVTGYNSKTSAQFFQFFNSTTVPADATAPVITIRVAALSNFSMDFGAYGRYFSTGIAWSNSSTGATKTIGSADMFVDVNYK